MTLPKASPITINIDRPKKIKYKYLQHPEDTIPSVYCIRFIFETNNGDFVIFVMSDSPIKLEQERYEK